VLEGLPVAAGATVLDLGAGTGKLTRVLVRRYSRVIAVEPLDGMRAILEKVVPQAECLAGRAEEIPLPDASVDAVFAAQAFHWFATDEALTEITRVLRRGGVFCLVWNGPDGNRPWPLPQTYTDYLEELRAERSYGDGPPFGEVIGRGPFGEINEFGVPHDHVLDRQRLLDNARSVSWIASRPSDEHQRVMRRLGRLLPQGTYSIPNIANVMWTTRS
jgi:SAM-dependent methyltransferase